MDERPREENVTVVKTRSGGSGGAIVVIVLILLAALLVYLYRDTIFGASEPARIDVDVTTTNAA